MDSEIFYLQEEEISSCQESVIELQDPDFGEHYSFNRILYIHHPTYNILNGWISRIIINKIHIIDDYILLNYLFPNKYINDLVSKLKKLDIDSKNIDTILWIIQSAQKRICLGVNSRYKYYIKSVTENDPRIEIEFAYSTDIF